MAAPRYASRARRVEPAAAPAEPPGMISFGSGDAYPEGFPDLRDAALRAVTSFRTETPQYAPRPGLPALREWIAGHLGQEAVRVTPEHVLVVNGAKHGLDLVCKLFLDPGDLVVVTAPTYQSALPILRGYEARHRLCRLRSLRRWTEAPRAPRSTRPRPGPGRQGGAVIHQD